MEEPKVLDSIDNEISCKGCGASLTFKPGTSNLECQYCGAENPIEIKDVEIEELNFHQFLQEKENAAPTEEITTVKCGGCGAESSLDPNIVSDRCPFCGQQIVVANAETHTIIKPESLLPFKIERQVAFDSFKTWLHKLWWAPNDLKKFAVNNDKLAGMYIPYWTYDSETSTNYTGQRGEDYTDTETYTVTVDGRTETRTRTVTKTRWYPASGSVARFFDDLLVLASRSLSKKYVEKLEPWDLPNLVPFDEKFLSGFRTETYQVELEEGFGEAKTKMKPEIEGDIRRDIGGDRQRIHSYNTAYNAITFKHVLLPLWISAYMYKSKSYRFLVNARTGEVQGERPYSWVKITLAILASVAIIVGGYFVYQYYQGQ